VELSAAPALAGYVVTIAKPRAQLLLVGPESDPILATWSAGVGRAGAFTSDYKDRWGRAWTGWDGASRLFGQLGRDLSRRLDDPNVRWEAEATTGELSVRATVFDDRGRRETLRRLRARVAGPEGFSREVLLEAVGAGSYTAKVPLSRPGAYLATLVDDERDLALATTGAALSAGEELRPSGTDRGELSRIAGLTGGKMRDTLAGIFNDRARRFAYSSVNGWLATLAAACLLLSVASRRLALPNWTLRRSSRRARARTPTPDIPASSNRTLSALRQKRERKQAFQEPRADAPRPDSLGPRRTDLAEPSSAEREPSKPPVPPATAAGPRVKTAAEILLERRRSRGKQ
jgi:Ca-activated chloride channel family protein